MAAIRTSPAAARALTNIERDYSRSISKDYKCGQVRVYFEPRQFSKCTEMQPECHWLRICEFKSTKRAYDNTA